MRDGLYRTMRMIRRFEERVVDLVNANEIAGVTHEYVGQEAVAAGVCAALRQDDVITSTHRGHGHLLAKGADPRRMMAELLGRTTGLNRGRGGSMHIADLSLGVYGANGIVAAGTPFAAGAAWAAVQEGSDRVAVSFFGDGGVNQGVLLETMNLASVWELPVIFVCENNGYAVTMAAERATAGSIVERARSYGMPAEALDGMNAEEVLEATERAVERGRAREGPSFLECRTYRFFGHHTAERTMKLGYRTEDEIAVWRARDPLEVTGGQLDARVRAKIDEEVELLLDEAIEFARASERPEPNEALDFMYGDGYRPRQGIA
ncbi:MAG: thiamine pyrophosphate-dependent dehydrogenase E1 component subunit alpha [Actinomycetota bacterium]|nr:thiamine pyrophosphate-dependent dehydrogenase E1 component subunit alpha [Actinomycetota bacterium]